MTVDIAHIPAELRSLKQWVIWREEVRNGKPTKVPYQPTRPTHGAKADDPETWGTFEQAMDVATMNGASGIGFEFSTADPYVGVDIDKCRNASTGALSETAASWIDAFSTYTEVSPTGTGLHMIGRGKLPGKRNRKGVWEVYDHGRYFTVTGQTVTWSVISDIQDPLDKLYAYLWPEPVAGIVTHSSSSRTLTDHDLLEVMFQAANGDAIRDLYEGKWDARYTSQSEADYALCLHLAFWTARDPGRMDAIFRGSGLMRDKWDNRRPEHGTYGADTIANAITQTIEVYEPRTPAIIAPIQETPAKDDQQDPFKGLSHHEVLALELAPDRYFVNDLIPVGAVGTIAGVPETHKSFIAQAMAVRVAAGEGEILGRQIGEQTNVGFFWQDDSTRAEIERVKLFETIHSSPPELPVWWFLNLGIQLPGDVERLRLTVEEHSLGLIFLDSFYNFASGLDLKDAEAELLVATLKREIADTCECTVVVVDHMPWANESNRGRLRSYGGVFKGAATRFGIYIDAVGNKLWIEARGNNIVGFKRTLAEWDADQLEMRLISAPTDKITDEEYEQKILDHLAEHPDAPTSALNAIKGTKTRLLAARDRLVSQQRIVKSKRTSSRGYAWNLAQLSHAQGSRTFSPDEQLNWFDQPAEPLRTESSDLAQTSGAQGSTGETNHIELFDPSTGSTVRPYGEANTVEPLAVDAPKSNDSEHDPDDDIPLPGDST